MGIRQLFKKQLSSVIEWTNQDPAILFYKYPSASDEIKNASQLIIAPGQGCIIVYEGKIQDILTEGGKYFLDSDNHPFITTLLKLRQNFESEHKMRLYFFRTAELVNQKWGTASPVKYMDSVYAFPVELGAYGNYSLKLVEAKGMFSDLIGSKDIFMADELREIIISRIIPELTSYFGQSKYSYQEIDSHLSDISKTMLEKLQTIFVDLGVSLTDFRIEATSFDSGTQERINKIANLKTEALSAAEAGLDYVELEKLRALRDAAKNEGGLAGAGLQIGAGLELSKSLMSKKEELTSSDSTDDAITQLKKLKLLVDEGILTQDEFDQKKKEILSRI